MVPDICSEKTGYEGVAMGGLLRMTDPLIQMAFLQPNTLTLADPDRDGTSGSPLLFPSIRGRLLIPIATIHGGPGHSHYEQYLPLDHAGRADDQ